MKLPRRVIIGLIALASVPARLAGAASDPAAGTWQMIVLTGPAQIEVAAPLATSHPDYQAELAAIKAAQGSLTADQREAIAYWSRGGVLRWWLRLRCASRAPYFE